MCSTIIIITEVFTQHRFIRSSAKVSIKIPRYRKNEGGGGGRSRASPTIVSLPCTTSLSLGRGLRSHLCTLGRLRGSSNIPPGGGGGADHPRESRRTPCRACARGPHRAGVAAALGTPAARAPTNTAERGEFSQQSRHHFLPYPPNTFSSRDYGNAFCSCWHADNGEGIRRKHYVLCSD